jgi:lipopolysaccharide biosynthesis protein
MPDKKPKVRLIAFYLPQYHTIPENDEWWGKGFTDWDTVRKAKPLFKGHWQPHIPGELGYYNLLDPGVREKQAELASEHGIEGFCYWHYWLGGGKRLLERPFEEVLTSGRPDFPFCLAWANHPWTATWFGAGDRILIEQKYPGIEDNKTHFYYLLKAFKDPRYIKVNGKPLFYIHLVSGIPDLRELTTLWRDLALKAGLKGLYIVGEGAMSEYMGMDASCYINKYGIESKHWGKPLSVASSVLRAKLFHKPRVYSYKEASEYFLKPDVLKTNIHPTIIPNWDNTPRMGHKGYVFHKPDPELFRAHLEEVLQKIKNKDYDERIAFVKSWNEWAEGNYLEPDKRFGRRYLEVLKEEVSSC